MAGLDLTPWQRAIVKSLRQPGAIRGFFGLHGRTVNLDDTLQRGYVPADDTSPRPMSITPNLSYEQVQLRLEESGVPNINVEQEYRDAVQHISKGFQQLGVSLRSAASTAQDIATTSARLARLMRERAEHIYLYGETVVRQTSAPERCTVNLFSNDVWVRDYHDDVELARFHDACRRFAGEW